MCPSLNNRAASKISALGNGDRKLPPLVLGEQKDLVSFVSRELPLTF